MNDFHQGLFLGAVLGLAVGIVFLVLQLPAPQVLPAPAECQPRLTGMILPCVRTVRA